MVSRAVIPFLGLVALIGNSGVVNAVRMTIETKAELAANVERGSHGTGISGQVQIRPVRPHATIAGPNLAPYQAKFDVLDASGKSVTTVESDSNGNFRLSLPPGKYVLRPQTSGPYPRASEQTVIVPSKGFTQVQVIFDSGIR